MFRFSVMLLSLAATVTGAAMTGAFAQQPADIPEDFFQNQRVPSSDSITFCVNPSSMLVDFDKDLAKELADRLLLHSEMFEIQLINPIIPYDFRLPLFEQEIFWYLLHRCDAFMGFTAASEYPEWLVPSPIYLSTETILAARSPEYRQMNDIPRGSNIGVRIQSLAAGYLGGYVRTLPEASRWEPVLYLNNGMVVDRLMDGAVEAILIWEPALAVYLADHPDAPEVHAIRELPFPMGRTEFVLAMRPQSDYLNLLLSQAIKAVTEDGTVESLKRAHGLTLDRP